MPTLGFLKKKRTREGNSDPAHPASGSNPTSPVTPTSKHFDWFSSQPRVLVPQLVTPPSSFSSSGASRAAGDSEQQQQQQQQRPPSSPTAAAVAASGGNHYNHHHQQQHPSQGGFQGGFQGSFQGSLQGSTAAGAVHSQRPMNAQPPHPYPASSSMSTSASASATTSPHSHATSKAGSHDSQNLPSISSLINPPQHDGAGNAYINSSSSYPATLSAHITPPASASPGTDPSRLQHQQHQAHPPPPMQSTMQQHTPHQGDQQQQLHQQAQQLQQQEQHMQQQPQPSQPRVTKGKYSLVDFEIQRTLGTGSFGRVHLVQSKHNQRFYAVKVLKKAQVVKMKQVEHTNDERRMLSDVKHPFLITLWGTFQDWKNLYMVMDFVEGGELFSLLRKSGRFPNPVAKFYAAEVTLALEYLHSKNIIYRDLKPENLLLDRHGHLKITDFGFAKRVPDKTWTLCGTPDYLAPEVVSNKGYNKSVDWWSLGILIYEMLCGYTPFWDSGSPMKIYENILKGKVKYPGYINPDAQDLLQRLITADLTKRLGNLFGGSQDVKNHPWFSEVTWDRLARKDIDAPYTPPVKAGAGDASQFDRYPEDPEKYGIAGGNDEFGHLFTEF